MGKYYLHQQDQKQWICYLCGPLEGYNRNLYLQLQDDKVEGIVPVKLREEARGKVFFYDIGTKVALSHIFSTGITEEKLLKLLLGVVSQASLIQRQGIAIERILWSPQCIFVDQQTSQIGFLIDFGEVGEAWGNIINHIDRLVMEAKIVDVRFSIKGFIMQYLKDTPVASLEELSCYLEGLYQNYFGCREYSGRLTLTSRLDEKGIHIDDFVKTVNIQERRPDYTGQVCLIRARTKECVTIDKEYFYIGKEASAVDYCIDDNAAISRSHACIVYKNSRYYIRDLDSTNHTYVNNLQVSGNQLEELRPGYRITIANEVLYFQTRLE